MLCSCATIAIPSVNPDKNIIHPCRFLRNSQKQARESEREKHRAGKMGFFSNPIDLFVILLLFYQKNFDFFVFFINES
jgi:hypothetical protein